MENASGFTVALIDVDGTLVSSNDAHAKSWQAALKEFGYDVSYDRLRRMIGMGGDKVLPAIDPKLNDEADPGKSIAFRRGEIFKERYLSHLQPTNGAREMLVRLHACGLKIVIASSATQAELDALLAVADVTDLVDLSTTSDDAGQSKPAPEIIEVALKKAKTPSTTAVMIGDTPYDIEAATKAGVPTVAFRCGGWDNVGLKDAIAVYDDPADLLTKLEESPFSASC